MKKQGFLACIFLTIAAALFADPVSLVASAREKQFNEDWYAAIELYQDALRENPSFLLAEQGLAECFYSLGEYEQALVHVTRASRLKKDDPALLNLQGFISIGLGDLPAASQLFSRVLTLWPNDISARFGLAEIEIHTGRISSATGLYRDALARNPENRKALLSLAIVSHETGNPAQAREYIQQALRYHGENPQVFYFAGYLAVQDGRMDEAERHVRRALSLRKEYDAARELLAIILYRNGRYGEVVAVCDERIAADRKRASAWYMKTLALEKTAAYEEALTAARTGLDVSPEDDILRSLLEIIIIEQLPFEDPRRKTWSVWHIERAKRFQQQNLAEQALFEYRRALRVYPDDVDTRYAYARLLLARGYPAQFVSQLEFIHSLGKSTTTINDAIESYGRLLSTSVHRVWKIEPLYLDKGHTTIGLFYQNDPSNILHPDSERICTHMLAQSFTYNPRFVIHSAEQPVKSYSEAYRISRQRGDDYFILLKYSENDRDTRIRAEVHISDTGSPAQTLSVFRTGNDRFPNALRRMAQMLSAVFPLRGTILARHHSDAVVDIGMVDGVQKDQVFDIVDSRAVRIAGNEIGLSYEKSAVLGTLVITEPDEDIAKGTIRRTGFYDRITVGDAVILAPQEDEKEQSGDTDGLQSAPALFRLIRQIR